MKYYYYEEYIYKNLSEIVYFNYYSTEDNTQHVFDVDGDHWSFDMFGEEAFLLDYNSRPLFGSKKREVRLDSNDVFHSKLEELTKEEYFNELMLRELKR